MYLRRTWFALVLSWFLAVPVLTSRTATPDPLPSNLNLGVVLNLITQINVFISVETLLSNEATVNFDVQNPLIIPLVLNGISSEASINGTVFGTFSQTFNPGLLINPNQTINSGNTTNFNFTQGFLSDVGIISETSINLNSNVVVFDTIPLDSLMQNNVPTTFSLELV